MQELAHLLVVLHVVADMVWVGSILSVAVLLSAKPSGDEPGAAARLVYQKLANPAFMAAFGFGAARLVLDLRAYFVLTHFMHAKLLFALGVIALHHVIGARAKKRAGAGSASASLAPLALALLGCAALTVYFAVLKPF